MAVQQVETATVVGTVTGTGNATVVITSARMTGSPKTLNVAVTSGDTATVAAGAIRLAMNLDSDVAATFAISGTGADVILTEIVANDNDDTLNVSIDNGTCTGLTAALTSANTTAGDDTNLYATLAQYKAWIAVRGLSGSVGVDISDDVSLTALLEAVSRHIDNETGKRFYLNVSDETRYYHPDDSYEVKIDPLATLTSVSVDYALTRSYTALVSTDYDLLPTNAALDNRPYTCIAINTLVSAAYFPKARNGLKLVGKFGWPATPADIGEATKIIAQSVNSSRSGQFSAGRITVTAAGIVIRPEEVPAMAQRIINRYRSWI